MVSPEWIERAIQAAVVEASRSLSEDELFDFLDRIVRKDDLDSQEEACRTALWFDKASGLFPACRIAGESRPGASVTDRWGGLRALKLYMQICRAARERDPERLEVWLKSRVPAK